jgi:hypothetical protein
VHHREQFFRTIKSFETRSWLSALALLLSGFGLASCGQGSSTQTTQTTETGTSSWSLLPTFQQLTQELNSARTQEHVPTNVQPPISDWASLDTNAWTGPSPAPAACWPPVGANMVPDCVFGDTTASREIVVTGDSQAWMWVPALSVWGIHSQWKIRVLAKSGCPPWIDPRHVQWTGAPYPQCREFESFAERTINDLKPAIVIAVGVAPAIAKGVDLSNTTEFSADIRAFVTSIAPSRSRLLVFHQIPYLGPPNVPGAPPFCLASNIVNATKCVASPVDPGIYSPSREAAYTSVVNDGLATMVSVQNLLCSSTVCPMVVGSRLIYSDQSHVNRLWSEYVARALGQLLTRDLSRGVGSR